MAQRYVDLAILGGGCAGLSLAHRLSEIEGWNKQTLIIESRAHYLNDRSWCFWESLDAHLQGQLEPIIKQSWLQWRFSNNQFSTVHSANGRRYCFIAAEDFYQRAIAAIHQNSFINLQTNQAVLKTEPHRDGNLIMLRDGSSLVAQTVIDTRPPIYTLSQQAKLWQIFYGIEIETQTPFFDSDTVGLMEQLVGVTKATQFLYVLPFSKTRALVELTQFSSELFSPTELVESLNQSLKSYGLNVGFTILRHEQGCLPMGLQQQSRSTDSHYYFAGTPAGAIRPATGYAFIRIQQWANRCAFELSQGRQVSAQVQSTAIVKAMDAIFLNVLHDDPALGAKLFQALAQHVSGPALVRFLMDEASRKDYWQVIRALPAFKFLLYSLNLNRLISV
jgi:lycopene beta-cyclase